MKRVLLALMTTATATPIVADEAKLKIVTSFTILADMVRQVGGDRVEVVSITKPGANIHTYQPTPRDLVQAVDADGLIYNGLNLEAWFEQFTQGLGDVPRFVASEGVETIAIAAGDYQGAANPHAWMSAKNAQIYVDNITQILRHLDPVNSDYFLANGDAYQAEIAATFAPLAEGLADYPPGQRYLVTCEGAFSYLAQALDLQELYLWPINADQVGTPQQVRNVIDAVRENHIPAVFCESTVNTAPAEQVARETGAYYGGVLYVDSLSAADGPVPSYLDLLRVTTATIVDGLAAGLALQNE